MACVCACVVCICVFVCVHACLCVCVQVWFCLCAHLFIIYKHMCLLYVHPSPSRQTFVFNSRISCGESTTSLVHTLSPPPSLSLSLSLSLTHTHTHTQHNQYTQTRVRMQVLSIPCTSFKSALRAAPLPPSSLCLMTAPKEAAQLSMCHTLRRPPTAAPTPCIKCTASPRRKQGTIATPTSALAAGTAERITAH